MNDELLFNVCSVLCDFDVNPVPNVAVNDCGIAQNTRVPLGRIASREIVVFARLDSDPFDAGRGIGIFKILGKNESFVFVGNVRNGGPQARLEFRICGGALICFRTHVVEHNSAIREPKRSASSFELKPDALIPLAFVFNKRGCRVILKFWRQNARLCFESGCHICRMSEGHLTQNGICLALDDSGFGRIGFR